MRRGSDVTPQPRPQTAGAAAATAATPEFARFKSRRQQGQEQGPLSNEMGAGVIDGEDDLESFSSSVWSTLRAVNDPEMMQLVARCVVSW